MVTVTRTQAWCEDPGDNGSTVWGCELCHSGGWCADRGSAREEMNRHVKRCGEIPGTSGRRKASRDKIGPDRDALITRMHQEARSLHEIADAADLTTSGAHQAMQRLALVAPRQKRPALKPPKLQPTRRRMVPERDAEILQLWSEGRTKVEVARTVGMSSRGLALALERLDALPRLAA